MPDAATLPPPQIPDADQFAPPANSATIPLAPYMAYPSCDGPPHVTFPNNARLFGDLVWLMQRYRLHVPDDSRAAFDRTYRKACDHARHRDHVHRLLAADTAPTPATLAAAGRLPGHASHPAGARFTGTPRPYQTEGLAFLLANPRSLLADDMGLGKTVSAILLLATLETWPAVIVVPPHLVTQWTAMIGAFLSDVIPADTPPLLAPPDAIRVNVVRGRGLTKGHGCPLPPAHIHVVHYLLLESWRDRLIATNPKVVIFDEIQELRHDGTAKYSAASLLSEAADRAVGLSGTPIYGYGLEIWNVINAIEHLALGPKEHFTREWCQGYGDRHVATPDALGDHLRAEGLMLRRTKRDVAVDMPPKHRAIQRIDADESTFTALMTGVVDLIRVHDAAAPDARRLLRGQIGRETRQATGIAKAPAVAAFIATLLEAGEAVVGFAHHHAVVDILLDRLKAANPVCITGRQTPKEKDNAKQRFLNGDTGLIIIGLRSATGIDGLQRRSHIAVFAELDWSPAVHSQAEDRVYRDDQFLAVLVYYLVSSVGSDPDMEAALGLKIAQAKGLLHDPIESEADRALQSAATSTHLTGLIDRLRTRFALPSPAAGKPAPS